MKQEKASTVYFADAQVDVWETEKTLPAKFIRLVKKLNLAKRVKDKNVAIKMHFGRDLGFTTIHPLFVSLLVKELKDYGANSIKVIDNSPIDAIGRGYTREVIGCQIASCFGESRKYLYPQKINFKSVDEVYFSGEAIDSDFIIDFSHAKGHGNCGFGGAIKNIGMGMINNSSRSKIHQVQGGLRYNRKNCAFCLKCLKVCAHNAIRFNKKDKEIYFLGHECTRCQHCFLECPHEAIQLNKNDFDNFSKALAIVTNSFIQRFHPENIVYINMLTNVTIYCDCWGLSLPAIVPDIGILGSYNICAIDKASLDMIKTENMLKNGLPKNKRLLDRDGHLFEKVHGKDPYKAINSLSDIGKFPTKYKITEVK